MDNKPFQEQLRRRGRQRVARYSWQDLAKQTLSLYEQAGPKSGF